MSQGTIKSAPEQNEQAEQGETEVELKQEEPDEVSPQSGEVFDQDPTPPSDELDVIRLPSLHTPVLDVDPHLVVHRFSQTGHSHSEHPHSPEYEHSEFRGTKEGEHEEGYWDFWEDEEGHYEDWRDSYQTGDYDYGSYYYYDTQEGEEELEDTELNNLDDDDTIGNSPGQYTTSTETDPTGSSSKHTKTGPVGLSKASFRWFERKVLSEEIPDDSEEHHRRTQLLEKCQLVRKVSKPIVTIFGGKSKTQHEQPSTDSIRYLRDMNNPQHSKLSMDDSAQDLTKDEAPAITFPEFSDKEWALKNAIDYLKTAGCTSSRSPEYGPQLKSAKEEAHDFRLALYEKQLKRRRNAIGNKMAAPEINAALLRHAERAICRAVIDNTKPRYPLPRFILPRHLYLKKVQSQFIGPGSYEHDVYDTQVKLRQMQLPSTWNGCSSRFPKDDSSSDQAQSAPQLLDPWTTLDAANNHKRHPGTSVPFESTPCNYRGVALLKMGGSRIPPNAYHIKSPLDEFIKKRTSVRGPYDCYTPSRSVIPYGYYKTPSDELRTRLGPGSYEIGTNLEKEFNDSYHSFKGKFGIADRQSIFGFKAAFDKPLWPRKGVKIPPPGQYNIDMDVIGSNRKQNKEPFMSGKKNKEFQKVELMAPDYYYYAIGATWEKPPKGASCASVFNSATPQIMSKWMTDIRRLRNKAANRKLNLEEGPHQPDVHHAPQVQFKKDYVLEDCPNICTSGPKKDLFAVPGYGIGSIKGQQALTGKCCNC